MKIRKYPSSFFDYFDSEIKLLYKIIYSKCDKSKLNKCVKQILLAKNKGVYGKAISSIDKSSTYTNNSQMVGIGKTIFDNKSQKSSIVLRYDRLKGMFDDYKQNANLDAWDYKTLDEYFTIFHELGHAVRYSQFYKENLDKPNFPFKIKKNHSYYLDNIIEEVYANKFAAPLMNKKFADYLSAKIFYDLHDDIDRIRKFTENIKEVDCFNITGNVWVIVRQIQEAFMLLIYYYDTTNIHLSKAYNNLTEIFPSELIAGLLGIFRTFVNTDNRIKLEKELVIFWNFLIDNLGYKVIEGDYRDSVKKLT